MATWQLSRMRVGMASPVARWVRSMTWMATLRPLRTSSSTSRDSSATRALWALTSGLRCPCARGRRCAPHRSRPRPAATTRDGPRCQASVTPRTWAMAPWRSTISRCTRRSTSRTSSKVVLGRQPGPRDQPVVVGAALAIDQHELDGWADGASWPSRWATSMVLPNPAIPATTMPETSASRTMTGAAVLGPAQPPRGQAGRGRCRTGRPGPAPAAGHGAGPRSRISPGPCCSARTVTQPQVSAR